MAFAPSPSRRWLSTCLVSCLLPLSTFASHEPVFADLNGGLQFIPDLKTLMTKLRKDIMETSEIRAGRHQGELPSRTRSSTERTSEALYKKVTIEPRANIKFDFPHLPDWKKEVEPLNENLKGMVDLEKVVVVTGFAEVGPWGNSRTRWEMEAYGKFSLEGCVEMAWIMGLIKNHNGPIKGKPYSGWVDAKTGEPVDDKDVKPKYEKYILEHSGIRLIEPELFNGYDPNKKQLLQEVVIEEDLEPFETSKETAEEFKREHGDKVEIFEIPEIWRVHRPHEEGRQPADPQGPAVRPSGRRSNPHRLGRQALRYPRGHHLPGRSCYLVCSCLHCRGSLLASGITDPYEFYKYVHVSEVGNCVGSGIGGTTALRGMYKDRYLDKPLQKDILQESFINTMSCLGQHVAPLVYWSDQDPRRCLCHCRRVRRHRLRDHRGGQGPRLLRRWFR